MRERATVVQTDRIGGKATFAPNMETSGADCAGPTIYQHHPSILANGIELGYGRLLWRAITQAEGSHSGLVRPPAKRVGGVEPPRGFESRTLRHTSR